MTTATQTELPADVRVTLVAAQYLSEHGGRLPAGTVVLVDEQTAKRWLDKGIARPSAETDRTIREQKLAEIERLKLELEAIPDAPVALPITRAGGVPSRRS